MSESLNDGGGPRSALFKPLRLRKLTLPNRIVVSPMCQYVAEGGRAADWHRMHVVNLACSGAGMMCIEATSVTPEGRITPGDLGLWDDATEAALQIVVGACKRFGQTPIAIQLAHAGRKASSRVPWEGGTLIAEAEGGWQPLAPSAVPQHPSEPAPLALDAAGLARIRDAFVAATERAVRIGIDAIEVHGAHGYLLHEFLSPISNRREDSYGGSLENRMRFPLEIFDAVRAAFPQDRPIGVKVSAMDWVEGGWDLDQTVAFASELQKRGADWVTASGGGISPLQKITVGPGYQVPFAAGIRARAGITTMAVGLITDPHQAEHIVASGEADCVALARAMLYDPRWPWHAAAELGEQVDAPPPYWRAPPHGQRALFRNATFGSR
jgi:NADPH2 dehydrogenase